MALRSCCGCISLKKGSLTIGILSLIGCVGALIFSCIVPSIVDAFIAQPAETDRVLTLLIRCVVKGVSAGLITLMIICIILTGIFIHGVVKENHKLMAPYLWVGFTGLLGNISLLIGLMTLASSAPESLQGHAWGYFCQMLFSSLLSAYFLAVVYYHFIEVKQGKNRGVIHSPA